MSNKCAYVSPRNGKCSGRPEIDSPFCGGHRCTGCSNSKPSKDETCGDCSDLYESPVDTTTIGDDYRAPNNSTAEYDSVQQYDDESDYASLLTSHQTYGDDNDKHNFDYAVSSEDLYASVTAPRHTGDAPEFSAVANESIYYAVTYDVNGAATLVLDENDEHNLAQQLEQLSVAYDDDYDIAIPAVPSVEANNYELGNNVGRKPTSQNNNNNNNTITNNNNNIIINNSGPNLPPRNQSTQQASTQQASTTRHSQTQLQTGAGLPHGWEVGRTRDGRVFYLDHNTKRTSWNRPQSTTPGEGVPQVGVYMPLPTGWALSMKPIPHFIDHNTRTTHLEDPRPLPHGWQQFVRKTDGVPFFLDTINKRTQWDHPCSQQQSSAIEMQTDASGRAYFINHNTRQTSWEDPRLQPGFFGLRGDGLPAGVERHFGPNNQVYYLDHRNKTSSWQPPTK